MEIKLQGYIIFGLPKLDSFLVDNYYHLYGSRLQSVLKVHRKRQFLMKKLFLKLGKISHKNGLMTL